MKNLGRVLVVDDDTTSTYISTHILHLMQAAEHVISATNGPHALDLLMSEHVDLVLLDVQMPGMDGFKMLDSLLEQLEGTGRQAPAIFLLTSSGRAADIAKALAYRSLVSGYLTKPLTQQAVNWLLSHS